MKTYNPTPNYFTLDSINEDKIYLANFPKNQASFYKLHKIQIIPNCFAFILLEDSSSWANGKFSTMREAIEKTADIAEILEFDNVFEMCDWIAAKRKSSS